MRRGRNKARIRKGRKEEERYKMRGKKVREEKGPQEDRDE